MRGSIAERMDAKVMPVTECGCHIWLGATGGHMGYGHIKVNGRVENTHRVSWELYRGKVPDGMNVLHTCDIPTCVNPDHLFIGDHRANMDDKKSKRRAPHGSKHHKRVVSEKEVIEIRSSAASVSELAARFSLGYGTVWQIKNQKRWKYVGVSQ